MNIINFSLGQVCKLVDHGIREFMVGTQSTISGVYIASGVSCCYQAYKDISAGRIKRGLIEGAVGAFVVASGVYHFITTWQKVIVDADTIHCRKWSYGELQYKQKCSVYKCTSPILMQSDDSPKCLLLEDKPSPLGFSNVYEMKQAPLRYEFTL